MNYRKLLSQIMKRSSFFFFELNPYFIEKDNPSDKNFTIWEELDAVEVDGIRNLLDSVRLMFID